MGLKEVYLNKIYITKHNKHYEQLVRAIQRYFDSFGILYDVVTHENWLIIVTKDMDAFYDILNDFESEYGRLVVETTLVENKKNSRTILTEITAKDYNRDMAKKRKLLRTLENTDLGPHAEVYDYQSMVVVEKFKNEFAIMKAVKEAGIDSEYIIIGTPRRKNL
ncbi:MAG: hypothetical protein ABEK36_04060 [Candidatus Aenigmatarchaeota archaeon]